MSVYWRAPALSAISSRGGRGKERRRGREAQGVERRGERAHFGSLWVKCCQLSSNDYTNLDHTPYYGQLVSRYLQACHRK